MCTGITVCAKKNGKQCLVVDCRPVNTNLETPLLTQEGLSPVSELIEPLDQLILVDAKDGFHHVGICEEHQTFFSVKWQGNYWTSLCFGISCAPYFFCKI